MAIFLPASSVDFAAIFGFWLPSWEGCLENSHFAFDYKWAVPKSEMGMSNSKSTWQYWKKHYSENGHTHEGIPKRGQIALKPADKARNVADESAIGYCI